MPLDLRNLVFTERKDSDNYVWFWFSFIKHPWLYRSDYKQQLVDFLSTNYKNFRHEVMKATLVPQFLINFNLYFNVSIKQPTENNTFIDVPPCIWWPWNGYHEIS